MIHMRKKFGVACLLVLMLVFIVSIATAETGTVTTARLMFREGPSTDSKPLQTLTIGTQVEIIGREGDWYKVTYMKMTGYVYAKYITTGTFDQSEDGVLCIGDKGNDVKKLQERLKTLGYYTGACDGDFDARTEKAVKAFQKANGLTADGIVGPVTEKKLKSNNVVKGPNPGTNNNKADDGILEKGEKGDAIKLMQKRLKELGYFTANCDGDYDNGTVTAVKNFQKVNKLAVTGIADAKTQKKINSDSALCPSGLTLEQEAKLKDGVWEKGEKGDVVKEIQELLAKLGYYKISITGNFGDNTYEAVKAFQKKNGLTVTGAVDKTTLNKMKSSSAICASGKTLKEELEAAKDDGILQEGEKGDEVKALQKRLTEMSYYKANCNGTYGSNTVAAVKDFQKKNGLTANGIANAATQKKIYDDSSICASGLTLTAEKKLKDGIWEKGEKGDEVKKIQERLCELGYFTGTCNGTYGSNTVEAVKDFQKKNGLTVDGVVGNSTLKKLNSSAALCPSGLTLAQQAKEDAITLERGDTGASVKKLQERLKELGYFNGTCNGNYGSATVTAVKNFQKKNGLTANGVANSATQKKLNSSSALCPSGLTLALEKKKNDGIWEKGESGSEVKKLQKRLATLGYYKDNCDGDYGTATYNAVKAFQKKNKLTANGIANVATQSKLYADSAINVNGLTLAEEAKKTDGILEKGEKGDEVKKLQERLKELGFYTGTCNGNFGTNTEAAVKAFQKKNGLTANGIVNAATKKKLDSSNAINVKGSTIVDLKTNQTLKKGDKGPQVKALQNALKKLGYYTGSLDSSYGYSTATAVSDFQRANRLTVNGIANPATLRKLLSSKALSKSEAKEDDGKTYKTERLDWFKKGASVFAGRPVIQIKDVRTGLVFKGKVLYGTNHLDVEPLTKADTAILLKINGGVDFSWRRRAMLVKHNGHVYAASIYSEPHGDQTIYNNNFDGQFCLHFYGSKTHGTRVVDKAHQECVAQAMKATW